MYCILNFHAQLIRKESTEIDFRVEYFQLKEKNRTVEKEKEELEGNLVEKEREILELKKQILQRSKDPNKEQELQKKCEDQDVLIKDYLERAVRAENFLVQERTKHDREIKEQIENSKKMRDEINELSLTLERKEETIRRERTTAADDRKKLEQEKVDSISLIDMEKNALQQSLQKVEQQLADLKEKQKESAFLQEDRFVTGMLTAPLSPNRGIPSLFDELEQNGSHLDFERKRKAPLSGGRDAKGDDGIISSPFKSYGEDYPTNFSREKEWIERARSNRVERDQALLERQLMQVKLVALQLQSHGDFIDRVCSIRSAMNLTQVGLSSPASPRLIQKTFNTNTLTNNNNNNNNNNQTGKKTQEQQQTQQTANKDVDVLSSQQLHRKKSPVVLTFLWSIAALLCFAILYHYFQPQMVFEVRK